MVGWLFRAWKKPRLKVVEKALVNHFALTSAARRYVQGRPYFHPIVIAKIRQHLGLSAPVSLAVDVGCGTGLSTVALKKISRQVIGLDPSKAMLELAPVAPAVHYVVAGAEQLPLSGHQAALITVSSAFYWFDRRRFFNEAARVLAPDGWVIIYDNAFSGQMVGNSDFAQWMKEDFWVKYPYPPGLKSSRPLQAAEANSFGFSLEEERYQNTWSFSWAELVEYLLSLSNITWAIENGRESLQAITGWLEGQLKPFFSQERHEFWFNGPLLYLHRQKPSA
jgi:SAM-dependent methyltransferase